MTPCYYCELDRETDCKICIHGDGDSYIENIKTQRDELLAALKIITTISDRDHAEWIEAHALIAKVEAAQ